MPAATQNEPTDWMEQRTGKSDAGRSDHSRMAVQEHSNQPRKCGIPWFHHRVRAAHHSRYAARLTGTVTAGLDAAFRRFPKFE